MIEFYTRKRWRKYLAEVSTDGDVTEIESELGQAPGPNRREPTTVTAIGEITSEEIEAEFNRRNYFMVPPISKEEAIKGAVSRVLTEEGRALYSRTKVYVPQTPTWDRWITKGVKYANIFYGKPPMRPGGDWWRYQPTRRLLPAEI